MLHSQFIANKFQPSLALEGSWYFVQSSKMSENRHNSHFSLTSRSSSFESVEENIDALEIVTPRTYSHSPSPVPQSSVNDVAGLQPWLYQLFPDSYVDANIGQPILNTTTSEESIFSSAPGMWL
jgi:hypothetical protein